MQVTDAIGVLDGLSKKNVTMKTKNIIIAAAVLAFVGAVVSCSKNATSDVQNQDNQSVGTKEVPGPNVIETPCETWRYIYSQSDTCHNWIDPNIDMRYYVICSVDLNCLDSIYIIEPPFDPGIGPLCFAIPNYGSLNPYVSHAYAKAIEDGEITFYNDCPLGNTELVHYLPEGYLPAGTYPISDRNGDAVIDITKAWKNQ